ncbi:MAG: hypothetical protein DRP13_00525 [Candidatus Aenigmatarchaeota archaeon]|nr:MAG: hypothetical protein DRP13_00525 [Candidatus Aenigmarchaeota archaeon]
MNQKFETRYVTLGICKYQDKHLLVKISPDYPYCPGDWDFIFSRSYEPDKSDEENILLNVHTHTGLNGNIIKKGSVFTWPDDESKINWIIWPCIVEVDSNCVNSVKNTLSIDG